MGADPGPLTPGPPRPALADLAAGRWSYWRGLDPLPTVDDVTDQLGAPLDDQPHGGMFGGSPTLFRRYSPSDGSSMVVVWFEDDLAVGVEIEHPVRSVLDESLEPPDVVLPSEVGDRWEQHVYGAHGLVLHVRADDAERAEVAFLLGLPPFVAAEFERDPLRLAGGRDRHEH